MIEINGLTRTYRVGPTTLHALRGIDLKIEQGEFVALMGPSGSGKSTLTSILGCLDRPSSGRYRFEATDVAGLSEPELARLRSQSIGFVFQSFNLLPRTSAIDNVALPLFYAGDKAASGRHRRDRARAALGHFGLGRFSSNTPAQLSGGQQQRVAIARSLINSPRMLLADEPTGNLDSQASHEIMATLRALNRTSGVTIVLVTHEADMADYADRILTLRDGRIVSDERKEARIEARPRPAGSGAAGTARGGSGPAFAWMTLAAAGSAIRRNALRSALTMLGVFIGVASLVCMVAIGQGAAQAVRKQIESLGTNLMVVLPGAVSKGGARSGFGSASTLTTGDAEAIRREDPQVAQVSYLIQQPGQALSATKNWFTTVQGVTASYEEMGNWHIAAGRALSDTDDRGSALVALIGQTAARELFEPYQTPLGAIILVNGVPLRIVGLLAGKGQTTWGLDQDDVIMVPFSTAERRVVGAAAPSQIQKPQDSPYGAPPNPFGIQPRLTGYVNVMYVQAASTGAVGKAMEEIRQTLGRRHDIKPGQTGDFDIRDLSQVVATAQNSSQIMTLLLASVASISLLVGGIGIMNILLVSVTERTREIGLRMAIGARRHHVLLQFLAEAVILSVSGGLGGILFGIAAIQGVSYFTAWPTTLSLPGMAVGFLFSAAVGIFFGYYPARKAAELNPIEALRYE